MKTEEVDKVRQIKTINFLIMSVLILIHIGFLFHSFFIFDFYNYFIHLTMWSFIMSSIYLIAILIIDAYLFFSKKRLLESYNNFIRNDLAAVIYPYCYTITIGFWGIALIGFIFGFDAFFKSDSSSNIPGGMIVNLHYHLFVCVIITLDIFLNERNYAKFNLIHFIVISVIALLYVIILCFDKFSSGNNAYVFMEKINVPGFVGTVFGIYGILVLSYFLFIFLVNKLNKNNIVQLTNEEGHSLLGCEREEGVDI